MLSQTSPKSTEPQQPMLDLGRPETDAAVIAYARAVSVSFHGPLEELAVRMGSVHRHAASYIEQAPALVLAVHSQRMHATLVDCFRGEPKHPDPDRDNVARRTRKVVEMWRQRVARGGKVARLLRQYGIAPEFRRVLAGGLTPGALWPIEVMSRQMKGPAIADSIPRLMTHQREWFAALGAWYRQMLGRNLALANSGLAHPGALTNWAAVAFGAKCSNSGTRPRSGPSVASELADFAMARGVNFDQRWTLLQAADACGHWHNRNAEQSAREAAIMDEAGFEALHQVTVDTPVVAALAPFPDRVTDGEWEAVLLRTGRDLWDEHVALSICTDEYFHDVQRGDSIIYSVRCNGARIAALELRRSMAYTAFDESAGVSTWEPTQFKATRNHEPPSAAWVMGGHLMLALDRLGIRLDLTDERGPGPFLDRRP